MLTARLTTNAPWSVSSRGESKKRYAIGLALVALGISVSVHPSSGSGLAGQFVGQAPTLPAAAKEEASAAYGKLPLAFVPNAGQTDPLVRYQAQAGGASFYFTLREVVFSFTKNRQGLALRLRFLGANPAASIEGEQLGPGRVNYLLGNDPAKWRTNLPTYGQVVYRDLWPGIDMHVRGTAGQLKYEFHLAPGARVSDIRLAYAGVSGLALDRRGNLALRTPLGTLRDTRPVSYQQISGKRVPVESRFAVAGSAQAYGFAVGAYDAKRPLVIDPGLLYSTFLGGSAHEAGHDIAVDAAGAAYVTGFTESANFPTTAGAFDTSSNGSGDGFVTKLNQTGSALVYSTYLGGSGVDQGVGLGLDSSGSAYVTGQTFSADFPTTVGAFDTSHNGDSDGFVAKLDPTGSALVYSTYLGGTSFDNGNAITLDATGSAFVAGTTDSGNFPTTPGAFDTSLGGSRDGFVTKLDPTGSALVYSTYLGGSAREEGGVTGIAVEASGDAYLTGQTESADFPTTPGAFDTSHNGGRDAFATKLSQSGSALVYSTYLGGSGSRDEGNDIEFDVVGNAYVTGLTNSANFPTTPAAFDTTFGPPIDGFVTKLNTTGSALVYSTYLGGTAGNEQANGISVDASGSAYVTGGTEAADFPTTPGAFDTSHNGASDAFVTKLNAAGSAPLLYSTFLGGSSGDGGNAIAIDASGPAYVTGQTGSADFPTTPGAFDTSFNGATDAFVAKLDLVGAPATVTLSPAADTNPVGTSHTVTATVTDAGGNPVPNVVVRFSVTGSVTVSGQCTTDANGQCDFTYQGPDFPGEDVITAYADTNDNGVQDPGEPGDTAEKNWVLPVSTPGCKVTYGGWIIAANGDRASFGGVAMNPVDQGPAPRGQQQYTDHGPAQPLEVHSKNVLALVCTETEASIFGDARVNGSTAMYRIDLKDLATPGSKGDTYRIRLSSGYDSGEQTLKGGNVVIH